MGIKINHVGTINELYAWIVDDVSGKHGIIGFRGASGSQIQAATSRLHVINGLRGEVQRAAKEIGLPIKLVHFRSDGMYVIDEVFQI